MAPRPPSAAEELEHSHGFGSKRCAQPLRHNHVESRQRRAVDKPLRDRSEHADHQQAHDETDGEVQGEVFALRKSAVHEPPGRGMVLSHVAHPRRHGSALKRLIERGDNRRAVPGEPAPEEDDAGDDGDEDRQQQAHSSDVVHEPRQVPPKQITERTERAHPDGAAQRVVHRKDLNRHARDAGKNADEAANERDEASHQHGLGAVLPEEPFSLLEPWRGETDPPAVAANERQAAAQANPVAGLTTGDRTQAASEDDAGDRQRPSARECSSGYERCLARNRYARAFDEQKHGNQHIAVVGDPQAYDVEHPSFASRRTTRGWGVGGR